MILPTNDERDIMAKQVHVLVLNSNETTEVLGSYSEPEFARNAAQIYINDVNDNYGYGRVELRWKGNAATVRDDTAHELFIQFSVEKTLLDEDVRL